MSSSHLIILCRNRQTGELRIEPNMTLYDMYGAKQVLETVQKRYDLFEETEDWVISIYKEHWEPVPIEEFDR